MVVRALISSRSTRVTAVESETEKCYSHTHTRSHHLLSNIIIYPPTCVFSLLYLFGFCGLLLRPWRDQCCEYRVGSFTGAFFMFTSFHAVAREGSGAICLIGSFCLQCCDRASVISSHIVQGRTLPSHFPQ